MILPENSYHVNVEDDDSNPDKDFLDRPILQFFTWQTPLYLVQSHKLGQGLNRFDIADEIGDWCGSIVIESWMRTKGSKHKFIAISDAKSFTKEECDIWTY
jgi:hypothetical protein